MRKYTEVYKKMDKKYLIGLLTAVIIIPTLTFSWKNIQSIWAAPNKVSTIEKKVEKQEQIQENLSKLVLEQHTRLEKQEAVTNAQIDALKYIVENKEKKRK